MASVAILDQFGTPFPTSEQREQEKYLRRIRARYDAAQTDSQNQRHWQHTDSLSAASAHDPQTRRMLRERGRYEFANNSYCQGLGLTLANDTIGTGPSLRMQLGNTELNKFIEQQVWGEWARLTCLARKLRTNRLSRYSIGEGVFRLYRNPTIGHAAQIDLRGVEADQMATAQIDYLSLDEQREVDGIRFDSWGNPSEYHFLKRHPGAQSIFTDLWEHETVPADQVIHLFRSDRDGQRRGVPEITPALELFAKLRRFTDAVILAAETAADFTAIMKTNGSAEVDTAAVEAMDAVSLYKNMMLTLPKGWDVTQMRAEQPTTTYQMFVDAILQMIGRCLCMPFIVIGGNAKDYNYASGRLDLQSYRNALRVDRSYYESDCLDKLFWAVMSESAMAGLVPNTQLMGGAYVPPPTMTRNIARGCAMLKARGYFEVSAWLECAVRATPGLRDLINASAWLEANGLPGEASMLRSLNHKWRWNAWDHVDPEKVRKADKLGLSIGLDSHVDRLLDEDRDPEDFLAEQANFLGVSVPELQALIRQNLFGSQQANPVQQPNQQPNEPKNNEPKDQKPAPQNAQAASEYSLVPA